MRYVILSLILLTYACNTSVHLVNTAHLDHLYQERLIGGQVLGTQWIYCEAPSYTLLSDDDEGYTCVDDVARALVFYCRAMHKSPTDYNLHRVETLSNFLLHMHADNGYFYNFMLTDGQINKTHKNSVAIPAFWTWRAYWALTELLLVKDKRLKPKQEKCEDIANQIEIEIANLCIDKHDMHSYDGILISSCIGSIGSDQMAEILKGLSNHYYLKPNKILKSTIEDIGHLVMQSQICDRSLTPNCFFLSWQNYWHAWGNSQSYALLKAGAAIGDTSMTLAALQEINEFYNQILRTGYLSSFKLRRSADGNLIMCEMQQYDQISYGISPMIFATTEAFHYTKNESYADMAFDLASWYFGKNNASATMFDVHTGRGYDGINDKNHLNVNAGAESTIESLLSMQTIETLSSEKTKYRSFVKKCKSQNHLTKSN